jgi:hypothetical protein
VRLCLLIDFRGDRLFPFSRSFRSFSALADEVTDAVTDAEMKMIRDDTTMTGTIMAASGAMTAPVADRMAAAARIKYDI